MIKLKVIDFSKLYNYILSSLIFFIPINNHIVAYLIGGLLFIWILEGDFKKKFIKISINKYTMLFIGYYLIYLIGLTYSKNIKFGIFDLGIKSSILIFPIIFSSLNIKNSFKFNINNYLKWFIYGCITASIICLTNATFQYMKDGYYMNYYYTYLSILTHPSYFAMYLTFAISIIILFLINVKLSIKIRIAYYFLILFFTIMLFLLSSKSGLVTLVIIFLITFLYIMIIKKKYLAGAGLLGIMGIGFFIMLLIFPYSIKRILVTKDAIKNKTYSNSQVEEGTGNRIQIWKISMEIIKEHPITGVGTGDVKDELLKKYKEKNFTYAYERKFNAHSQYIQTWIATGLTGFIILLMVLFLPLIQAIKKANLLYIFFLSIIIFNITVESMFEVQAGVVFYGFFNSFLYYKSFGLIRD